MPNHIQNWDMVYAMTFNAVNKKLEKFKSKTWIAELNKEKIVCTPIPSWAFVVGGDSGEVRIAIPFKCEYSYLGLKLSANSVELYGVKQTDLKKDSVWKPAAKIQISDFEKLYPDSVRQIVNEVKRIAFPKHVNTERREFWIDFCKDTVSGTIPIIFSKLSEWSPAINPTDEIMSYGKIKDMKTTIDTKLNEIKWPGDGYQGLSLQKMDLDGNFRLAFKAT
jgi:hypothetical protein